mgnify:CR=1 FL=1
MKKDYISGVYRSGVFNAYGLVGDYHVKKFEAGSNAEARELANAQKEIHGTYKDGVFRPANMRSEQGFADNVELDGQRYRIVVLSPTTFSLKDVISGEPIDSTSFTAYVSGGRVTLETHVISLNNPQVSPYDVTPYVPNPYAYDPVEYKLTAGSAVMGSDNDVFLIEVVKYGQVYDLGDLLT